MVVFQRVDEAGEELAVVFERHLTLDGNSFVHLGGLRRSRAGS